MTAPLRWWVAFAVLAAVLFGSYATAVWLWFAGHHTAAVVLVVIAHAGAAYLPRLLGRWAA